MYSSPADVRFALAPGGAEDSPDTAAGFSDLQLIDAIKEADGVIDTYLNALYKIPMDPDLPEVAVYPVRAWSRDIAGYLATLTYRKSKDMAEDDPVRLRFLYIMDILNKILEGLLKPNLPPQDDGTESQGAFVYNLYGQKLFTWADVFWPGRGWSYIQEHRYGDLLLTGSGYDEVLVLTEGEPIPSGTPENTLVVFVPEGT